MAQTVTSDEFRNLRTVVGSTFYFREWLEIVGGISILMPLWRSFNLKDNKILTF
jgi:hypothetical protein